MPPDFVVGHDLGAWANADRGAQEYNRRLVNSNSTRVGGRHYAPGCLHLNIPDTCWMIDPKERPFDDTIIDIAATLDFYPVLKILQRLRHSFRIGAS